MRSRYSWQSFTWLLSVCIALFFVATVDADDLFKVKDIKIAADGVSATQARETAIADGQVQAFKTVAERLIPPSKAAAMQIDAIEINRLVQSMEVQNEHISASHYEAVMQISFNPVQARQLLEQKNLIDSKSAKEKIDGNHQLFAISVSSPAQWVKIRGQLKEITSIKQLNVKEITIQQVVVDMNYKGTFDAFGIALQQKGFMLTPRRGIPLLQFVN
ncbi:MAG: hypothetical protein IPP74_02060 [Alphaproteobacteria bacterium]|nr:hypothetical protein [Alphaproteobacteria bacterium]